MTFYPVFKLLKLVDPTLEPPAIVAEFVSVPFEANTFTWLHQFYTDFGVAGVLLGPLVAGLLASGLYFHMLRTRRFYSTYATALLCFCLTLSIMVNHLTQGPAWFFLAIGAVIALYIRAPHTALVAATGRSGMRETFTRFLAPALRLCLRVCRGYGGRCRAVLARSRRFRDSGPPSPR